MNALVSIITPSYNSAKFIAETIQSVQNQTYQNWEMIIVDDGSSDETEAIVLAILENDSRIQFYKLAQNSGAGVARNIAVQKSKGNFIAFLDSDDMWMPEKLHKQLTFMEFNKVPLTFSFYDQIDEESNSLGKTITSPNIVTYTKLFYCNWVGNLTGIYSVDYFGKVAISSIKKRQDWILWLTLVKKSGKIIPIQESLAYYRVRKNSISSSKFKLIKHNYLVYKIFHENNWLFASFNLLIFLIHQLFIKPFFKRNADTKTAYNHF